jgi:hypothetical protein
MAACSCRWSNLGVKVNLYNWAHIAALQAVAAAAPAAAGFAEGRPRLTMWLLLLLLLLLLKGCWVLLLLLPHAAATMLGLHTAISTHSCQLSVPWLHQ